MAHSKKEGTTTAKGESIVKAFPVAYVKHGLNGTKAYQEIKPNTKSASASVASTRLLKNVKIQKAIEALLPHEEETMQVLRDVYAAEREAKISYKDLHKYWETDLKLRGKLKDTQSSSVNIGVFVDNKDK